MQKNFSLWHFLANIVANLTMFEADPDGFADRFLSQD